MPELQPEVTPGTDRKGNEANSDDDCEQTEQLGIDERLCPSERAEQHPHAPGTAAPGNEKLI